MNMIELASFDWIIVGIIAVSAIVSLFRGFVKEIMSLAGFALAIVLAIRFQQDIAPLVTFTESPVSKQVVSFFAVFVATLVCTSLVSSLIIKVIDAVGLSPLDRLLGVVFGALRGGLIVLVALLFLPEIIAIDQEEFWKQSKLVPYFLDLKEWVYKTFGEVQQMSIKLLGIES